jgi:hypothetical protein
MAPARSLALFVVLACSPAVVSPQEGILVPGGIGTGLDFVQGGQDSYLKTPLERKIYVGGFISGLLAAGLLGADNERIKALELCTKDMTDIQIAGILEKDIKENPKDWHRPLSQLGFKAIGKACDLLPE